MSLKDHVNIATFTAANFERYTASVPPYGTPNIYIGEVRRSANIVVIEGKTREGTDWYLDVVRGSPLANSQRGVRNFYDDVRRMVVFRKQVPAESLDEKILELVNKLQN
jgi:hypothetical protein